MGAYAEVSAATVPVFRHACGLCSLQDFCWPPDLADTGLNRLHQIIRRTEALPAGRHLFRSSDPFTAVFAVRTGCVKTYTGDSNGHETVHGFHLPGELLGFDAVHPERHRVNALLIKDTAFCIVAYKDIAELSVDYPGLQNRVLALMSRDFSRQQLLAAGANATQRTAIFFFDLETRLRRHRYADFEFTLPMSREDIASYLQIRPETLSRVMSKLQQSHAIGVNGRRIRLQDIARLGLMAQGVHQDQSFAAP